MADLADHIEQADHNEACANFILAQPEFRDWAITVAFYAAVHLAEACFTQVETIEHTEIAVHGKRQSPHSFRRNSIDALAPNASAVYETFYAASKQLRYLEYNYGGGRQELFETYFPQSVAERIVTEELPNLRSELEKVFDITLTNHVTKRNADAYDATTENKDE